MKAYTPQAASETHQDSAQAHRHKTKDRLPTEPTDTRATFVDNRPEAIALRKHQAIIAQSPPGAGAGADESFDQQQPLHGRQRFPEAI